MPPETTTTKLEREVEGLRAALEGIKRHGPGCNCGPGRAYSIARAALEQGQANKPPPTGEIMHPSIRHLLQFFQYGHLPDHLKAVSAPVGDLASRMASALPQGPELTAGLRKLLEAKDCFVRARLAEKDDDNGS